MAKRKRLTPANPAYLDTPAPETKSMFQTPRAAPIADVARDASSTAALNEMADTLARAREDGRMVVELPLDQIDMDHLVRDRLVVEEAEMRTLKTSLRSRGQQTPIEVVALGGDRYGLISGWRRCHALAQIAEEDRDDAPTVLALLRKPEEAAEAYLAMVEENEIRVDLSYFERARIVAKAVEEGVFAMERTALQDLFRSASRAKRSKIGSFLPVVRALDGHLRFPHVLSERLGLSLAQALNDDPEFAQSLHAALAQADADSAEAETAVLTKALARQDQSLKGTSETKSKASGPAFRDETIGAFTLRRHADGTLSILGASWPKRMESDLKMLLKAASDRVEK
ncbi:ParB/RepB/Spo0J family partition protein [Marivita hallyeonensis]|uniref:ParB/RepB/Spo0J family partition protein n=1 Tax=Marivita hallyeonensis TaxID=996342 RepID=A0A1M5Y606_9RHOB|nr:ParB N-terminal domain-containing protein [Marivita hallyeonensis]SHI07505.1 ParB/RepB/Spo0J family partition protein [Marivita hallyeonensis]